MKNILIPAIGAAAFCVGGLVARQKAFEVIETLEKTLTKSA